MSNTAESNNKALVLKAFDTLFNSRDYAAAERFWSPRYIQHSAHVEPGREGLFNVIKGIPPTLKYEPGIIVAEGDYVIVQGRFSGFGQPVNWIAADILRIENGVLVEHRDVIQDEATDRTPPIGHFGVAGKHLSQRHDYEPVSTGRHHKSEQQVGRSKRRADANVRIQHRARLRAHAYLGKPNCP